MTNIFLNLLASNFGGQRKRALEFYNFLAQADKKFSFVILKLRGSHPLIVSNNRVKVIEVDLRLNKFFPVKRLFWENMWLRSLVKKYNCDVFLTFSHYRPFLPNNVKSVVAVSNLAPFDATVCLQETLLNRLRLKLLRHTIIQSCQRADLVIALSSLCKEVLTKNNVLGEKITVIPNGVRRVDQKPHTKLKNPLSLDCNYILCVSHFYRYKNFETLIRGFSILKTEYEYPHKLRIIGRHEDKKYVEELYNLVESLNLQGAIEIYSELDYEQLGMQYLEADIIIFPSLIENSPNILLEAMSYGKPIVSSNCAPMPEFGKNSILYFEAKNEIDLSKQISKLLDNEKLRNKYSRLAKRRAEDFTWYNFSSRVLELC